MFVRGLVLGYLAWMLTSCLSMDIYTESNPSNDFSVYKSFAWSVPTQRYYHADQNFDNDIVESSIVSYVNNELYARNYRIDTIQPDIVLSFNIITKDKVRQDQIPVTRQVYRPYYYNPYNPYAPTSGGGYMTTVTDWRTVNVNYEEGTLNINIIDRKQNKLVWKGRAVGTLDDPTSFLQELPDDIKAMFKKYPVPLPTKP